MQPLLKSLDRPDNIKYREYHPVGRKRKKAATSSPFKSKLNIMKPTTIPERS